MKIVHIVRRFGKYGGMETYVWELVHALARKGVVISIICEEFTKPADGSIEILRVSPLKKFRSRWRQMRAFRTAVDKVLYGKGFCGADFVHSHERSISHHITTFHGTPLYPKGILEPINLSVRYNAWQEMERNEVLGYNVRKIVCVSSLVRERLKRNYPEIQSEQFVLGWPGSDHQKQMAVDEQRSASQYKLLFVGTEWKRKGLEMVWRIYRELIEQQIDCSLDIYGPDRKGLPKIIRLDSSIRIHGWCENIEWNDYDLLILPAIFEPFGMVVAEARAAGLSVLTSEKVGALDLNFSRTSAISLGSDLGEWVGEALDLLRQKSNTQALSEIKYTWDDLAESHICNVYI